MELCLECNHLCHCKGVAPNPNTNQCMGNDGNCLCIVCKHNSTEGKDMNIIKKVIKWIWSIICWPFKKVFKWLGSCLPNG